MIENGTSMWMPWSRLISTNHSFNIAYTAYRICKTAERRIRRTRTIPRTPWDVGVRREASDGSVGIRVFTPESPSTPSPIAALLNGGLHSFEDNPGEQDEAKVSGCPPATSIKMDPHPQPTYPNEGRDRAPDQRFVVFTLKPPDRSG